MGQTHAGRDVEGRIRRDIGPEPVGVKAGDEAGQRRKQQGPKPQEPAAAPGCRDNRRGGECMSIGKDAHQDNLSTDLVKVDTGVLTVSPGSAKKSVVARGRRGAESTECAETFLRI